MDSKNKIRLGEIPTEGRTYTYCRLSKDSNGKQRVSGPDFSQDLGSELDDLIAKKPYWVELTIRPLDNAYEMRGHLKTEIVQLCSHCGWEFEYPIDRKFHEILIEDRSSEDRKAHSVHGNHSLAFSSDAADGEAIEYSSDSIEMTTIKGGIFRPGPYVHEMIGLSEPFYPVCGPDGTCLHAAEVEEIKKKLADEFAKADEEKGPHPAFSVLAQVQLEKSNKH